MCELGSPWTGIAHTQTVQAKPLEKQRNFHELSTLPWACVRQSGQQLLLWLLRRIVVAQTHTASTWPQARTSPKRSNRQMTPEKSRRTLPSDRSQCSLWWCFATRWCTRNALCRFLHPPRSLQTVEMPPQQHAAMNHCVPPRHMVAPMCWIRCRQHCP